MRSGSLVRLCGIALLTLLAGAAIGAPLVAPYSPVVQSGLPFARPSAEHLLGTNDVGQDILSELIFGTRISLTIGVLAAVAATTIGLLVGSVAGYARGWAGAALMRTADLVLVLPFLPLMILLAAYVGSGFGTLIAVIAALGWARPARVIRAQALSVGGRDYVVAARAIGVSASGIVLRHVVPAMLGLVVAEFVLVASRAILLEASLAFLGLGDPTQKSWGTILFYAQARGAFLTGAWLWWVAPPGLAITAASLGFALVGFSLEERLNPRLRVR